MLISREDRPAVESNKKRRVRDKLATPSKHYLGESALWPKDLILIPRSKKSFIVTIFFLNILS